MIRSRGFASITAADFIVRSAYQMGKTPLLPIFAASMGAGELFVGLIVAASTFTGMVLKPVVGILSDRWGRRTWLLVGTAFFAGMPFAYGFVHTPEALFAVRMAHGLATAIYGPVTLAYVAELSAERRAERLGWFSSARNAGYIVGPLAGGWMLLAMDPTAVFTVIGLLSCLAFIPVLMLPETASQARQGRRPILADAVRALRAGGTTPAVWLAGGLDAQILIAKYAAKAFLPLHLLSIGVSIAQVGAFFAVQEAVNIAANPIGGRLSDRLGYLNIVGAGMALMGAGLLVLPGADGWPALLTAATLMGVAQGLVFPSAVALVSARVDESNLGLGMGLVGTMKNAGKVAGPVLAGLLIHLLDFTGTFRIMGLAMLAGGTSVFLAARFAQRQQPEQEARMVELSAKLRSAVD